MIVGGIVTETRRVTVYCKTNPLNGAMRYLEQYYDEMKDLSPGLYTFEHRMTYNFEDQKLMIIIEDNNV